MKFSRTYTSASAMPLLDVKAHLRVTHDFEDDVIADLMASAVAELEAYAEIAILAQTITATTADDVTGDVELPVGPVADGAALTVQTIGTDGTLSTLAAGFWLEAGQYPVLHITDAPNARLRITYAAGFSVIPADLALAIKEQVTRSYSMRGDEDGKQGLALAAARAAARYKRVRA